MTRVNRKQFEAAVAECEAKQLPLIAWPQDGKIKTSELPYLEYVETLDSRKAGFTYDGLVFSSMLRWILTGRDFPTKIKTVPGKAYARSKRGMVIQYTVGMAGWR